VQSKTSIETSLIYRTEPKQNWIC